MRFSSAQSLLSVCGYCRATLMRRDLDVENVGKMAELIPDPTPLQLGVEGRYRGTHFSVAGRIQVEYTDGAWNEWFLFFDDGKTGWLGEASGTGLSHFLEKLSNDKNERVRDAALKALHRMHHERKGARS